ncbi:hypothetical protein FI667_g1458, partial [Globisporangium splendens]
MNLNCVNARSRIQTESELEAASKKVESAFNRLQAKQSKSEQVQLAIQQTKADKRAEMQTHLQWLLQQKEKLEQEMVDVDKQLEDRKLLLQERIAQHV